MPVVQLRGGEVDGLPIHYLVEGRGPAIILVHGLGGFAESWRHNVAALSDRATVYSLDLPGFGRSAKPITRYGLAYFARVLHGFVETLGLPHVSLVGHSLGSAVTLTYALTHPARVERLALISTLVPGFGGYRMSPAFRLLAITGVGEVLSLVIGSGVYRSSLSRCFHQAVPAEVDFLVDCHYAERTSAAARAAWLATVRCVRADFLDRGEAYRRAIATLELPLLLVHGRQDPVIPASHCASIAESLPRARVRWIDECGHFPQIEQPAVVNGWLSQFLVGRPAPR
jgi:pimeloyl-ACP methyl ester carboxylesterase